MDKTSFSRLVQAFRPHAGEESIAHFDKHFITIVIELKKLGCEKTFLTIKQRIDTICAPGKQCSMDRMDKEFKDMALLNNQIHSEIQKILKQYVQASRLNKVHKKDSEKSPAEKMQVPSVAVTAKLMVQLHEAYQFILSLPCALKNSKEKSK
ncbi:MAG: hypothetical protein ACK4NC_01800 [Candidatus Gracilibacteria bacterium]